MKFTIADVGRWTLLVGLVIMVIQQSLRIAVLERREDQLRGYMHTLARDHDRLYVRVSHLAETNNIHIETLQQQVVELATEADK